MEEIKEFFENVRVIRQILERNDADKVALAIAPQVTQPQVTPQMPVQPLPVQNAVPQQSMPAQPQIPTTAQAESFTQEQIAVAMSRAQAAGRQDLIQAIFATFRAQTLMQIDPANYNQIAVMLREAGIEV